MAVERFYYYIVIGKKGKNNVMNSWPIQQLSWLLENSYARIPTRVFGYQFACVSDHVSR
jgi:hypothetical protein